MVPINIWFLSLNCSQLKTTLPSHGQCIEHLRQRTNLASFLETLLGHRMRRSLCLKCEKGAMTWWFVNTKYKWSLHLLVKKRFDYSLTGQRLNIYFGNLKTLWDEMVVYDLIPLCTCVQLKVLNEQYQKYYVIQNFTSHRKKNTILSTLSHIQGSTLENCYKAANAEPLVCSHCNGNSHMVEKCYKLHGYRLGHKLYKGRVIANQVVLSTSYPFGVKGYKLMDLSSKDFHYQQATIALDFQSKAQSHRPSYPFHLII
ncbi:hypothetical protein SADUNF_Sadunf07G0046800 [Salix dunnii]|uniref:Uncharacterized protein n=1 Tax=Salix dunnii TaxID=1413687 RepID=A0A835K4U2_9ROSI|nr:hypothetical protein SADUNF_Sadunf07G0046800 [Salix dunnii]